MSESLHEYVFLSKANASEYKTGYYRWTLPAQYYSIDRGTMCYVSIADGNVYEDVASNILVRWESGATNFICSNNDTGAMLKAFSYNDKNLASSTHRITSAEPIKLLVSARPRQIELSFFNSACEPISVTQCVIALKFEYLEPKESVMEYQQTLYQQM